MKPIYFNRSVYKDGKVHETKVGTQFGRAKDYAEKTLINTLVDKVEIMEKSGSKTVKVSTIMRGIVHKTVA